MEAAPEAVTWDSAVARVAPYAESPHHVIAVDQGLIVPNTEGMRPVEKKVAKALGSMHCSAYPSNRSNHSCFGDNAGIWKFLAQLQNNSYSHKPMSIPKSTTGRFVFECYPHPAIIAIMQREKILKYKCRHRNQSDWNKLLTFLNLLDIDGLSRHLKSLTTQNKANEDKLDSIVCAYTALLWWKHGPEVSSMIGSMETGYIVTPHTREMLSRFKKVFGDELNNAAGVAPSVPQQPRDALISTSTRPSNFSVPRDQERPTTITSSVSEWSEPVTLIATDTSNLSRTMRQRSRSVVINEWMNKFSDHRLLVKFVEEDGEPEVAFVPHRASNAQMTLMADRKGQPGVWFLLVDGASKQNPLTFRVKYRYQPLN